MNNLDSIGKSFYEKIRSEIVLLPNVIIIDDIKWSFIEIIGISDIVVTQGMSSSATIGLICGINSFYLDQANYDHEFRKKYFNKIVFNDSESLIDKISDVLSGSYNKNLIIDANLLKEFNAYTDDNALDRMREAMFINISKTVNKAKNCLVIIQARMGSKRLPGKVIKKIGNLTILELIIQRIKKSKNSNKIIVATSQKYEDEIILDISRANNVECFRGSEEDVLSRYYNAAKFYQGDVIVRITADCPFTDPKLIDIAIETYNSSNASYVSNTILRSFPRGFDLEVFGFEALEMAYYYAKIDYQREHVTPYIYEFCKIEQMVDSKDNSKFRVTVDTEEDYLVVKEIYDQIQNKEDFTYIDVLSILQKNEKLKNINRNIKQKMVFD